MRKEGAQVFGNLVVSDKEAVEARVDLDGKEKGRDTQRDLGEEVVVKGEGESGRGNRDE